MISVERKELNNIPCLVIEPIELQKKALPTVIYFHGFTSAKEHNLPFAYLLAKEGYRIILPDSEHHGERENNITTAKRELAFWEIIIQNINDLEKLKQCLDDKELILDHRVGIAGTSMGGMTTASALTQHKWIQSAAILMGTPKLALYANDLINNYSDRIKLPPKQDIDDLLKQLHSIDVSQQIDALANRPLLLWHGKDDVVVPANHAATFYSQAQHHYKDEDNIRLLLEEKQGHKVSRFAILETVKWFVKHL